MISITGNKKLDRFLSEADVIPQTILFIGNPKTKKAIILRNMLSKMLRKGFKAYYVTTDNPPKKIIESESFLGFKKFYEKGLIHFIDCYSFMIHKKPRIKNLHLIPGPNSLDEMAFTIGRLANKERKRNFVFVFDSVSTLLVYNRGNIVIKFLQIITNKIEECGGVNFMMLEKGMHDEKIEVGIEHISDVIFYFINGCFEVHSGTGITAARYNYKYKITNKGVEIK